MKKHKIVGVFEKVDFPQFGIVGMTAKLDTGAYSGALHSTKIKLHKTGKGLQLHFSPFDHPQTVIKTQNFETLITKSSNGISQKRYVINTTLRIQDQDYPIRLSLADRSGMRWPVLIGRRFLRSNNMVVDARLINK